ncbi:MAG: C39 family peptidase [Lachnospiraceae bacterium]|nr:C39 family peptidase [Lachnospiraceae bacterium]MDE6625020.1 C39 family peptidase [Lachnospiraceae bacterium]
MALAKGIQGLLRLIFYFLLTGGIVVLGGVFGILSEDEVIPACLTILFLLFSSRYMNLLRKKKAFPDNSGKDRRLIRKWKLLGRIYLSAAVISGIVLYCQDNNLFLETLPLFQNDVTDKRQEIPESLQEFANKYPEAAEFVKDYPRKKNKKYSMDLSKEVSMGEIPLLIQWDERWGYKTYGNNFLAVTGCGPTCISMLVCGLLGDTVWNPYEVARFAEEQGYYVPGEGTSWELMTTGARKLGLTSEQGSVSETFITEHLGVEHPLVCSMYPGDFTYTGHFIILSGLDGDGRVIVKDPNSRNNSEKHWDIDVLLPQIRAVWVFY